MGGVWGNMETAVEGTVQWQAANNCGIMAWKEVGQNGPLAIECEVCLTIATGGACGLVLNGSWAGMTRGGQGMCANVARTGDMSLQPVTGMVGSIHRPSALVMGSIVQTQ